MVANSNSQSKEDVQLGRGSPQETWFLDKIKSWFNPEPKRKQSFQIHIKWLFFIKILYLYISFSCSIYMSLLHDDFDSKTLRKWKEMQPLITIMFWWLINANKRLQNDFKVGVAASMHGDVIHSFASLMCCFFSYISPFIKITSSNSCSFYTKKYSEFALESNRRNVENILSFPTH